MSYSVREPGTPSQHSLVVVFDYVSRFQRTIHRGFCFENLDSHCVYWIQQDLEDTSPVPEVGAVK